MEDLIFYELVWPLVGFGSRDLPVHCRLSYAVPPDRLLRSSGVVEYLVGRFDWVDAIPIGLWL